MAKVIIIEKCGDCPWFIDNLFRGKYCNKIKENLEWANGFVWHAEDGIHEDCPLEDEEVTK